MKVANVKNPPPPQPHVTHHYVGRPSPLGNPFRIGRDGTREEVIQKYRRWLFEQLTQGNWEVQAALEKLEALDVLLCHCDPLPCHAAIIERAWIWWVVEEARLRYSVHR